MFILNLNAIPIMIQLTGGLMEDLDVLVCSVCFMNMVHLCSKLIVTKFKPMNGLGIRNQMSFTSKHPEE